ncbi:probable serine/threonine-protein kinase At1g01540 [Momordica charantia]|uniref:Probable serine/threonine-protein kinase At1g01540 n=1 Tax=Momordica charantia TaxID=3673 RepID=A0A6J1DNX7_MOMCH|nr:probable serine/threonine-protein kinase At1g01540 [Momordica charantia]
MSVLAASVTAGILKQVSCWFPKQFLLLWFVIFTNADVPDISPSSPRDAHVVAPAILDIPLPAKLPLAHQHHHRKYMSPQSAPVAGLAPSSPPYYGPLITSGHPPTSSNFSKPLMKSGSAPPDSRLENIAPIQSSAGAIPSGLSQPPLSPNASDCCKPDMVLKRGSEGCHCVYPIKIDLLLLNVSQNPNWRLFLEELASELGLRVSQIELINFYVLSLSRLNISMDITPHAGISFSAVDASAINSSLTMHKIRLDPTLVGDYSLLNITWFKPPPRSQAPRASASPVAAPEYHFPTTTSLSSPSKGQRSNLTLLIGIGAGFLFIAILFVLIVCLCASHRGKTKAPPLVAEKPTVEDKMPAVGSFPHPSSMRFLTYEELKEATNNFEAASILGEGGFGRVFKGVLSDGTPVAIKRLTSGGQQGDKEFLVEVEMLSRLHHRNLVKLVGYYSNRDSSQNLLCYELVPNGSLEAWLHGPLGVNCPLDWDTRMKIALDAARGLAYLHEDSQPCVIHRDFKASNILLENNFNAKVADFGLAKQAPEGRANYLSTRVMGTFGYVAPEYAMTGHLLVKSDVYSYGVVLLELLTGRKPVDMSQPSGQENLVTWARPILRDKDRLEELADPRLGGKYPKEDFVRVCTIAAACVAPEAGQRPTMGEVVQSLKMVQRVTEYQDTMIPSSNNRTNLRQSSTTFESDGSSSMFSSGPYSGLSAFDNDNVSRTAIFSEDLHEGR